MADAWKCATSHGDVISKHKYGNGPEWTPLFAIDDETREAIRCSIEVLVSAQLDIDDRVFKMSVGDARRATLAAKRERYSQHIAALTRLASQ